MHTFFYGLPAVLLLYYPSFAQQSNVDSSVYVIVEEMPEFPGGEQKLYAFLAENIKYPKEARMKNIQGMVIASFIVGRHGEIRDIKILRDIGYGCGEEVVRIIRTMPSWKPGKQKGIPVLTQFNLPVRFTLKGKRSKK